jgi:hypothetical protein
MSEPYPIHEVDPARAERPESMGSKEKFWFRRPADQSRWLFKYSRQRAGSAVDPDGVAPSSVEYTGEHWAEKIAAEIAGALAIPHVLVELAEERDTGVPGAMILDFTTSLPDRVIVHGNELLFTLDARYPKTKTYRTSEHTLSNILQALSRPSIAMPGQFQVPAGIHTASDLFVGYLLLDALIGNTDRHHENWALLLSVRDVRLEMAPTYDHASSMGRELLDMDRARRLATSDVRATVEAYAKQARSALYRDAQDRHPMGTITAFAEAAQRQPSAARIWQERLHDLSGEMLETIVTRVPSRSMSETSQRFAVRFLQYTRKEILALAPLQ